MKNLLRAIYPGLIAIAIASGAAFAANNYAATEGSGKIFSCTDIAAVCFPSFVGFGSDGVENIGKTSDAAWVSGNGTVISLLKNMAGGIAGAIPPGSAIIGKVGIDQTTPGTTNGVALVGVNGATALAGNGVTGTGSPRVTIASDNTAFPVNAQRSGTSLIADPCQANTPTIKPFSITTATTTNIVTGTAAKKIYVCYLYMQTAAANNIAVISGTTGATCGANTAALVGGTTAANGLNDAANSGQAFGKGDSAVMQVLTNNDDICIITSAATPLAGLIKYVVQ